LAQKPESSFGLPQELQKSPAASIFGGPSVFTSAQNTFGFQKPAVSSPGGFSFKSVKQDAQELKSKRREQEAAERLKLEQERKAKAKAEEEALIQKQRELDEQLERNRQEVERLRHEEERKKLELIEKRKRETLKACEDFLDSLLDETVAETVKAEAEQSVALYVKMPEDFYDALEVDEIFKIYRQEFLSYVNQTKLKYESMFKCFKQWQKTKSNDAKNYQPSAAQS
jgi:molecular chaperone GrpE (heat shock protein)